VYGTLYPRGVYELGKWGKEEIRNANEEEFSTPMQEL